jgi:hypothetical protein
MRLHMMLFAGLLAGISLFAQTQGPANNNQAAVVAFARKTAVEALNFHQGNVASFTRTRAEFTPEGWQDYVKHMEGFLDANGAPTFSSSFLASSGATVVDKNDGSVHLRIPGTLKQTQNRSSTTYRAVLDVEAGGKPAKIRHLETMTCPSKSAACR